MHNLQCRVHTPLDAQLPSTPAPTAAAGASKCRASQAAKSSPTSGSQPARSTSGAWPQFARPWPAQQQALALAARRPARPLRQRQWGRQTSSSRRAVQGAPGLAQLRQGQQRRPGRERRQQRQQAAAVARRPPSSSRRRRRPKRSSSQRSRQQRRQQAGVVRTTTCQTWMHQTALREGPGHVLNCELPCLWTLHVPLVM